MLCKFDYAADDLLFTSVRLVDIMITLFMVYINNLISVFIIFVILADAFA